MEDKKRSRTECQRPHPSFGHPPQIRDEGCTSYYVYLMRIWRGTRDARMKNGLGRDVNETILCSTFLEWDSYISQMRRLARRLSPNHKLVKK